MSIGEIPNLRKITVSLALLFQCSLSTEASKDRKVKYTHSCMPYTHVHAHTHQTRVVKIVLRLGEKRQLIDSGVTIHHHIEWNVCAM